MDVAEHWTPAFDPLLACCLCKRLLQEAVQLTCLHNCGRQCFRPADTNGHCKELACGRCRTITLIGAEQPNRFLDYLVQRLMSAATGCRMCDVCKESGKPNEPALEWCAACRHSLCEDCIAKHEQYRTRHVTQSLGEMGSLEEVSLQTTFPACAIHKKPTDVACRNCERVKCVVCCAECLGNKHEVSIMETGSFEIYVDTVIASIRDMECTLLGKMEALENPRGLLRDLKAARDRHLKEIKHRKRCILNAVEKTFEEIELSTNNAYDELEGEGNEAVAAANGLALSVSDAHTYLQLILESTDKCETINQQKTLRQRLQVLSDDIDAVSGKLRRSVNICSPL